MSSCFILLSPQFLFITFLLECFKYLYIIDDEFQPSAYKVPKSNSPNQNDSIQAKDIMINEQFRPNPRLKPKDDLFNLET